jgi:hypothetical protein
MVGAVNDGYARGGMPEMLAERQAAKARPEDNDVRFLVLRHVTVFIH